MTATANARELFKTAYEHRYTWDSNFPGYSADIQIEQGSETYNGHISIKPDFTVEVSGFSDEKVQESVYTQMRDIVTHRKRSTFENSHGKNSFSLGDVKLLPNGNYQAVISNNRLLQEIDPRHDNEVVMELSDVDGLGYAGRRGSLYGPPPEYGYYGTRFN